MRKIRLISYDTFSPRGPAVCFDNRGTISFRVQIQPRSYHETSSPAILGPKYSAPGEPIRGHAHDQRNVWPDAQHQPSFSHIEKESHERSGPCTDVTLTTEFWQLHPPSSAFAAAASRHHNVESGGDVLNVRAAVSKRW